MAESVVAGAAKTAANMAGSSEAAAAATENGSSMAAERGEAVRAEVEEEMEAVVPPELGGREVLGVTASQAPEACNHAAYRAPRE